MRKWAGAICLLLGAALIVSALLLFRSNRTEADDAGAAAQTVMSELQQMIQNAATELPEAPETDSGEPTQPPETAETMPLVELDGNLYIGYLTFPAMEPDLVLPVMADWSYPKLKTAPCRHFGSLYSDDLVIAGHNYDTHFGHLHDMEVGETVYFTDVNGETVEYRAEKISILKSTDVEDVEDSGYDLVLYTCTYNSVSRVTVFLNRADVEE